MTRNIRHLLLGTALLTSFSSVAFAQDQAPASADPQDVATVTDDQGSGGEEIVVIGFGQSRQVQTVSMRDIALLTPGTSPIKAIEKLPGVNYQAADPFGAYEWSTRISLRGFNQNQLGFTLDGVPLGDMSYGNHNGLHISRAIISENTGTVTVAQGAGSLATASTSNLGGTLQFTSRDPAREADVVASGTYGSDDTMRGFVRLESGDITPGGLRGYLSYGYLKTDKWKGFGEQRQHQINAKLVQPIGDGSISGFFDFSDRREQDYQDLSLEMIHRLGYRADNIANDWPLAVRLAQIYDNQVAAAGGAPLPFPSAGTVFPAPYVSVDDAYFDAAGLRRDYLGRLTADFPLTSALRLNVTGYIHDNHGQGIWFTPYVPTPGGAPISVRTTEYDINRKGIVPRLILTTGPNTLEVGGWYEDNNFQQARRFYGLDDQDAPSRDTLQFMKNPFFTQWDFKFNTTTELYYVADTLDIGSVTIAGGWKGFKVRNRATPIKSGGLASGTIDARDWFLPQIGAVLHLGSDAELFANFTQNMRAFASSATGLAPFATTQPGFDAIRGSLKPEKSNTYEAGGRFRHGPLQGSVAGYYVDFSNRLLALTNGAGIVGNPVTLQNVGAVRNYGVEATLLYRILPPLTLFASYAYNHSEYRDNVLAADGTILTATKGKTVVDSPRHMLKGEIAYDGDHLFGRIGADYMSKRFFTYTNDRSVPGRVIVDASIGYKFGGEGWMRGFAIEGSVTNLTGKRYVSTIGSNGFTASGDNQTLLAGAPRQFFVTLRRGF